MYVYIDYRERKGACRSMESVRHSVSDEGAGDRSIDRWTDRSAWVSARTQHVLQAYEGMGEEVIEKS